MRASIYRQLPPTFWQQLTAPLRKALGMAPSKPRFYDERLGVVWDTAPKHAKVLRSQAPKAKPAPSAPAATHQVHFNNKLAHGPQRMGNKIWVAPTEKELHPGGVLRLPRELTAKQEQWLIHNGRISLTCRASDRDLKGAAWPLD